MSLNNNTSTIGAAGTDRHTLSANANPLSGGTHHATGTTGTHTNNPLTGGTHGHSTHTGPVGGGVPETDKSATAKAAVDPRVHGAPKIHESPADVDKSETAKNMADPRVHGGNTVREGDAARDTKIGGHGTHGTGVTGTHGTGVTGTHGSGTHGTGVTSSNHTGGVTGANHTGGLPGTGSGHTTTGTNNASMVDKVIGGAQETMGKMGNNPNLLQKGAVRKTEGKDGVEQRHL